MVLGFSLLISLRLNLCEISLFDDILGGKIMIGEFILFDLCLWVFFHKEKVVRESL